MFKSLAGIATGIPCSFLHERVDVRPTTGIRIMNLLLYVVCLANVHCYHFVPYLHPVTCRPPEGHS